MWFIKMILLGAPRLGKTTMRRRLSGELPDISSSRAAEPSTGIVESGHSVVIRNLSSTTALVTPSEWCVTKDLTEEARLCLQYFYCQLTQTRPLQDEAHSQTRPVSSREATAPPASVTTESAREPQPRASASVSQSTPSSTARQSRGRQLQLPPEVADLLRGALGPQLWKDIRLTFGDTIFVKMEDTGGQPEFMEMLPALTIGPALYLLFCKLVDPLKSQYTVSYLSPSGECTSPVKSTCSVEEMLLNALASIACSRSLPVSPTGREPQASGLDVESLLASSRQSVAYIVATHKDLVSEQQIEQFDRELQQRVRATDFFKEGLVRFASEERMVLAVDNMRGGEEEVRVVRRFLEEGMRKLFKKLSIPASWLVLSLCLRKREERTASLESVVQLAGELGIPRREAMLALWFLHHYAGVLMHFPQLPELRDTVICDNQVVYDSATSLIVNTFRFGSVCKAAAERFRATGQFSMRDIREAAASTLGDLIPLHKLVKLLQHLNIIADTSLPHPPPAAGSREVFFMPCVLQSATPEELEEWWGGLSQQASPAPLFLRYKCGYVPIGVFTAMIAKLSCQTSLRMREEGIRRNRAQFLFGRDWDEVTLVSQPQYYAVHIGRRQRSSTPTHQVCRAVRGLLEDTLREVSSRMNYSFLADYQLGFECPSHPGREHLCVVDSQDTSPHIMCCLDKAASPAPVEMQSRHTVWFREVIVRAVILHLFIESFHIACSLRRIPVHKSALDCHQDVSIPPSSLPSHLFSCYLQINWLSCSEY